jgi:hypothetical protein
MAILAATVRSLSSFALFLSNACCLQSPRFVHSWFSGRRWLAQNWSWQNAHCPAMRRMGEVQPLSWQSFLLAMIF